MFRRFSRRSFVASIFPACALMNLFGTRESDPTIYGTPILDELRPLRFSPRTPIIDFRSEDPAAYAYARSFAGKGYRVVLNGVGLIPMAWYIDVDRGIAKTYDVLGDLKHHTLDEMTYKMPFDDARCGTSGEVLAGGGICSVTFRGRIEFLPPEKPRSANEGNSQTVPTTE